MSVSAIILAAVVVGGTGIVIGIILGIAGEKFKVEVDPKEEEVLAEDDESLLSINLLLATVDEASLESEPSSVVVSFVMLPSVLLTLSALSALSVFSDAVKESSVVFPVIAFFKLHDKHNIVVQHKINKFLFIISPLKKLILNRYYHIL